MSIKSRLTLGLSLVSTAIYGASLFYMKVLVDDEVYQVHNPALQPLGQFSYLAYHCLFIQWTSSYLHFSAQYDRSLVRLRDVVFTCLALPVGSVVVYNFWLIWHLVGREVIFPTVLSEYYPDWVLHATHTIIEPVNFSLVILVKHRYTKNGFLTTFFFMLWYILLLHLIKVFHGYFPYKYLDIMSWVGRSIYFFQIGTLGFFIYKLGHFLTCEIHGRRSRRRRRNVREEASQKEVSCEEVSQEGASSTDELLRPKEGAAAKAEEDLI